MDPDIPSAFSDSAPVQTVAASSHRRGNSDKINKNLITMPNRLTLDSLPLEGKGGHFTLAPHFSAFSTVAANSHSPFSLTRIPSTAAPSLPPTPGVGIGNGGGGGLWRRRRSTLKRARRISANPPHSNPPNFRPPPLHNPHNPPSHRTLAPLPRNLEPPLAHPLLLPPPAALGAARRSCRPAGRVVVLVGPRWLVPRLHRRGAGCAERVAVDGGAAQGDYVDGVF